MLAEASTKDISAAVEPQILKKVKTWRNKAVMQPG
jgi:hypothetical protein